MIMSDHRQKKSEGKNVNRRKDHFNHHCKIYPEESKNDHQDNDENRIISCFKRFYTF